MQIGQQLTSLEEIADWCLRQHKRVILIDKKGHRQDHGWKLLASMPLGTVEKLTRAGKLFRHHY